MVIAAGRFGPRGGGPEGEETLMHSNTWNPRRRAAVGLLAGSLAVGGVVLLPTAA